MTDEKTVGSELEKLEELAEERMARRVSVLELELQRLRRWVGGLVVGLLVVIGISAVLLVRPGLLGIAQTQENEGELRVRQLVLEGENGETRGEWRVDSDGDARLTFQDRSGETRLSLFVLESGSPGFSLLDARGMRRATLAVLPDETSSLVIQDESEVARAVLAFNRSQGTHIVFADASGTAQVAVGVDGAGVGRMMLPGQPDGGSPDR